MKHCIPLGTRVSFKGIGSDSLVYVVDSYQDVHGPCPPDCLVDHDCYDEPYITVRKQSWTAFPLSRLNHIFDESGQGREATAKEKMA